MKNLPILVKSIILLVVMAAAGILATGYMAVEAQKVAAESLRIQATDTQAALDIANAKEQVVRALSSMLSDEIALDAESKASFVSQMNGALQNFNKNMTAIQKLSPSFAAQVQDLQQRGNDLFGKTCAKSVQMAADYGNVAGQSVLMQGCLQSFAPYEQDLATTRTTIIDSAADKFTALSRRAQTMMWVSMLFLVLSIIVVTGISSMIIVSSITKPMNRLCDAVKRLSKGDFSTQIPEADRRDEVGQMANAVMVFKENGIERLRLEQAATQARADMEAERSRSEAVLAEQNRVQSQAVGALATGLEQLASGDLMFRITQEFSTEYEKLRLDFNRAIDALQHTMQRISENAAGVRSGAGEITQSADDLSRRTEQQAASLEETAAALDEVTATVKKASEGANEARGLADEAKTDAERSGDVVNKTVVAMGEIESSSKKISNIIGVIDEIAFQTNLLALNAGVEAARAGDAGRGFAVVATEVRALAQRSADAAKEIKSLIIASGTQVESGVKLVNETGQALGRIVDQVARLNVLVTGIASSSKEQATALEEVNSAVNQMDQVTQQNAAMVEQSTAASYALVNEAEDLSRLVGQFRIGIDTQKKPLKAVASKPVKVEAANAGTGAEAAKRRAPRVVSKPAKLDSFAVVEKVKKQLLHPTTKDDDWSEF